MIEAEQNRHRSAIDTRFPAFGDWRLRLSVDPGSILKGLTVSHAGLLSRQGIQPALMTHGRSIIADE
jgi:hypothetical protein